MGILDSYDAGDFFDEVVAPAGEIRPHYRAVIERLDQMSRQEIQRRQRIKDSIFRAQGITFTVYGDEEGTERTFPMDLVPRVIPHDEWEELEPGLVQRVTALNHFLDDLYAGQQSIVGDGVVPRGLVESADGYMKEAMGIPVPHRARCLVAGIDIVRGADGRYYVLEDNLRNPSGVSYVLENRSAMTRVMPVAFQRSGVRPVDHYPNLLLEALRGGAAARPVAPSRALHAGRVQLRLLRARLPRPPDGHRARRGRRPPRRRGVGADAHHPGAPAGRRHLPADRRRLPRPRGVPARIAPRRAGPDRRRPPRPRHHLQRGGQRRGRRQGGVRLRPGDDPVLPRRGAGAANVPTYLLEDRDQLDTCSTVSTISS